MSHTDEATASLPAAPMTDDEYVQTQGLRCPYCREHDVEGVGGVEIDAGGAIQEVRCTSCERNWIDRYHLMGYDPTGD
jgi:transposase-like protein